MLVQAVLRGAAVLLPFGPGGRASSRWSSAALRSPHVLVALGEVTLGHPTAHAHLAVQEHDARALRSLVLGRPRPGGGRASPAPWLGVVARRPALVGVLAYEHAYVQAGQAVPLA